MAYKDRYNAKFAQIYVLDPAEQSQRRIKISCIQLILSLIFLNKLHKRVAKKAELSTEVDRSQSRSLIEFFSGVIRTKNTPDALSGISNLQAEKAPEPSGSRAGGLSLFNVDE